MKYFSIALVLLAFGLLTSSCSKDTLSAGIVPQVVKDAFAKEYPDVKNAKWGMEGDNYSAEFKINKFETDAIYNAQGLLVATESEIPVSELPANIVSYIGENYAGSSIEEAERRNEGEAVSYEVEVKVNGMRWT
jgi:hypothetical protein